jgi:hypothetical protein
VISRRAFFASGAALLATTLLPRPSSAAVDLMQRDWFSAAENTIRQRRVLTEPLLLARGESLLDLDLIVPQNFRRTSATHAVTMHREGNRIRNVRILFETDTWLGRWQFPLDAQPQVGISRAVSGLYLPATANADIDGLHIEGAPRCGIEGWVVTGMRLRRYSSTRCNVGAFLSEYGGHNGRWDVAQVRVWDTWGPPGNYPSSVRPGGWIGGDGWVSEGDLISLQRMEVSGELYCGLKICRGRAVRMDEISTPSIMFQGSSLPDPALEGLTRLVVTGLYVNAATGYGACADDANKIQLSSNVVGHFDGGYIFGNGGNGNAIQATGGVHVDVRNFTIGGFHGMRGGKPACALELDVRPPPHRSTINNDFESVNAFVNQPLRVRQEA